MDNVIIQKENKILRKIAKEIPVAEIKSPKIKDVLKRMIKALNAEEDGVAIAAPQIGENLRIFVISKRIFELMAETKIGNKKSEVEKKDNLKNEKGKVVYKDMIFINPVILKTSKKQTLVEEGCLSVRWLYGKVKRAEKTLIKAYSEEGKPFTMGGSGLLSQAFQHETDHLDGILFTDKAINLKEMIPADYTENNKITLERTSAARSSDDK
ncbi:MAG: Peptide deformylase [Parcubacteria group bacterium GW2011_GWC1_34_10]|uniref:Peptide deformylase n=1 Tax=Candidatus Zambryskibacteria bacterium RIFCSPLOWO2_01_FULL_35_19 TaxID=1802757 RepID=A0A1G2TWY8_9BACT|nr:MAG: Peptide deformylase [Parcubacteria group bacterium GW2011_GWC1_34_10]OHB01807.1 MAG: hypothetical protein A3A90_00030 [Candidatus Zambryskibacteria bacterium RIFCSPLOWO2_01_FULL_35_19]